MEIFTYHRRLATEIMFTEMYIHEDCGTPLSLLRSPKTALPPSPLFEPLLGVGF